MQWLLENCAYDTLEIADIVGKLEPTVAAKIWGIFYEIQDIINK